jgi:hypothetical protein
VTFTPNDSTDYNSVTGSVNVTVNKSTPTVNKWPTASAIIYGQALSASTLSGGSASVSGRFTFLSPSLKPAAGTQTQSVSFTPVNSNYSVVAGKVSVTVKKSTPAVNKWPTASKIVSGQALSASTLSGGSASVSGRFTFSSPSLKPVAGTQAQSVSFTPANSNYSVVTGKVSVTVQK